jgi:hypothetical protein
MWHRVGLKYTDVSEERVASVFWVDETRARKVLDCNVTDDYSSELLFLLPWRRMRCVPPKRRFIETHTCHFPEDSILQSPCENLKPTYKIVFCIYLCCYFLVYLSCSSPVTTKKQYKLLHRITAISHTVRFQPTYAPAFRWGSLLEKVLHFVNRCQERSSTNHKATFFYIHEGDESMSQ